MIAGRGPPDPETGPQGTVIRRGQRTNEEGVDRKRNGRRAMCQEPSDLNVGVVPWRVPCVRTSKSLLLTSPLKKKKNTLLLVLSSQALFLPTPSPVAESSEPSCYSIPYSAIHLPSSAPLANIYVQNLIVSLLVCPASSSLCCCPSRWIFLKGKGALEGKFLLAMHLGGGFLGKRVSSLLF